MKNKEENIINGMGRIGISPNETKVYLKLLEMGPSTIMDISRKTKIARTTVYRSISKLTETGLVTKSFRGENKVFVAERPELALNLIMNKETEIKNKLREIDTIKSEFSSIIEGIHEYTDKNAYPELQVKFYDSKTQVKIVYKEILSAEAIHSFVNVDQIVRIFPENPNLFKEALKSNPNMEMWEIIEDNRETKASENNLGDRYHFRFLPPNLSFSNTDFIVFDGKVAMIDISESNVSALVINSAPISHGLKIIHKIIWGVLAES